MIRIMGKKANELKLMVNKPERLRCIRQPALITAAFTVNAARTVFCPPDSGNAL